LRAGKLLSYHSKWETAVAVDPLYKSYLAYADSMSKSRRMGKEQFGLALRKIVPARGFRLGQKVWVNSYGPNGEELHNADGSRTRKRHNGYHIPQLDECRKLMSEMMRWEIEWGDENAPDPDAGSEPSASVAAVARAVAEVLTAGGEDFELTDE
jgi:hypothetical protein